MFLDRIDAGKQLANKLLVSHITADCVIGLTHGGAVIAAAIADALPIPHDVLVVKKIGSPGNPELAIGAVAPDDVSYIDETLARTLGADETYVYTQISHLNILVREKMLLYRKNRRPFRISGRTVILADDGAATGATMNAAVEWVRKHGVKQIIVALPVAPPDVVTALRERADEVIVLEIPQDFRAVGAFYRNFPQLTDQDVVKLLL